VFLPRRDAQRLLEHNDRLAEAPIRVKRLPLQRQRLPFLNPRGIGHRRRMLHK
jgi:hypothetical protein